MDTDINQIIENKKEYLKYYNTEELLFSKDESIGIGMKIKKRGHLLFKEFYFICMWKSPRPKKLYESEKNKKNVEYITKEAFKINDEKDKILKLCELDGVQIPTASAILSVVFPEKYAVIDIRVLSILNEFKLIKYEEQQSITPKMWVEYLDILSNLSKNNNNIEFREIDKILFGYSVKNRKENLYK